MSETIESVRAGLKQVLSEQHDALRSVVEGLNTDALNWKPGPDTNSIAVLAAHLLGAEQFLIATAINQTIPRDRDAEFRVQAPDAATLLRQIDEAGAASAAMVDRLTDEDLSEIRQPAGDRLNRRFPGIWWLLHAVEHNREHIGQAMLTRQLYEQQHGQ